MTAIPIVVGYEYESDAASAAVFETLERDAQNCSAFRSTDPDFTRWFVLAAFSNHDDLQVIDWGDGVPIHITDEQRDWVIARRLARGFAAAVAGEETVHEVHHHSGAVTMPGAPSAADLRAQAKAAEIADDTNAWLEQNRADGGVCDFCCKQLHGASVTTYITKDFLTQIAMLSPEGGAASVYDYQDPYWAACSACDPVVQLNDPAALAQHVWTTRDVVRIGVPEARLNTPDELARLTDLYEQFYAGAPVRSETEPRCECGHELLAHNPRTGMCEHCPGGYARHTFQFDAEASGL